MKKKRTIERKPPLPPPSDPSTETKSTEVQPITPEQQAYLATAGPLTNIEKRIILKKILTEKKKKLMKKMAVEKKLMSGKYLPCCRHQRAGGRGSSQKRLRTPYIKILLK